MTSDPTPKPQSKPMLVGWDDGKIYLYLGGEEYCISDDPELFRKILDLCRQHFQQRGAKGETPCVPPPNSS